MKKLSLRDLKSENIKLVKKIQNLSKFLESKQIIKLKTVEITLLEKQLKAMIDYNDYLTSRISLYDSFKKINNQ